MTGSLLMVNWEKKWKQAVISFFFLFFLSFPPKSGGAEKNLRIADLWPSKRGSMSTNHYTIMFSSHVKGKCSHLIYTFTYYAVNSPETSLFYTTTHLAWSQSTLSLQSWTNFGGRQSSATARAMKLPSTMAASGVSSTRSGRFFRSISKAVERQFSLMREMKHNYTKSKVS
jgi:hypothetical protein